MLPSALSLPESLPEQDHDHQNVMANHPQIQPSCQKKHNYIFAVYIAHAMGHAGLPLDRQKAG